MNCSQCNQPLAPNARFCGNCGMPSDPAAATIPSDETQRVYPLSAHHQPPPHPGLSMTPSEMGKSVAAHGAADSQSSISSAPYVSFCSTCLVIILSGKSISIRSEHVSGDNECKSQSDIWTGAAHTSRCRLCGMSDHSCSPATCGMSRWIFGVQPYIHTMAQTQLDNAMEQSVQADPTPGRTATGRQRHSCAGEHPDQYDRTQSAP